MRKILLILSLILPGAVLCSDNSANKPDILELVMRDNCAEVEKLLTTEEINPNTVYTFGGGVTLLMLAHSYSMAKLLIKHDSDITIGVGQENVLTKQIQKALALSKSENPKIVDLYVLNGGSMSFLYYGKDIFSAVKRHWNYVKDQPDSRRDRLKEIKGTIKTWQKPLYYFNHEFSRKRVSDEFDDIEKNGLKVISLFLIEDLANLCLKYLYNFKYPLEYFVAESYPKLMPKFYELGDASEAE